MYNICEVRQRLTSLSGIAARKRSNRDEPEPVLSLQYVGQTTKLAVVKLAIALVVGFVIGAGSRWFELPVPAPPKLLGALLVLSITLGYVGVDWWLTAR